MSAMIQSGLKITPEVSEFLLKVNDYRDFLKAFIKPTGIVDRPLTFAELSRRAGFSSRAFPREVCLGHRSITLNALPKFIKALSLSGEWKDFFSMLVEKELDIRTPSERDKIEIKLERLRSRLKQGSIRLTRDKDDSFIDKVLSIPDFPRIFASLGSLDKGSSIEEIRQRIEISTQRLDKILQTIVELQLANFDSISKHYIPKSIHQVITGVGANPIFQQFFLMSLKRVQIHATKNFSSKHNLYLQTSFSITNKEKAIQLKSELREMIFKFVEDNEDPNGSAILDITIGMLI